MCKLKTDPIKIQKPERPGNEGPEPKDQNPPQVRTP